MLAAHWGLSAGDPGWDVRFVLNGDATVDVTDISLAAGAWLQVCVPADPAATAPPLDQSVVTDLFTASQFLYSGPDAIQTGVVSGTIEFTRTAVLRGRVLDRDGNPLAAVTVSVLNSPEYGQTRTRSDGMYDLVVNGGGLTTFSYTKDGYLPAQRQVDVPWQDYQWLPDVVLIPLDPQVTEIDLAGLSEMAVARGSVISDTDGLRQTTVLFPVGTQAVMTLTNGLTQTLPTLNVRATEYTVGDNGPEAMPGDLPPNSSYTYAFELSVDEALTAGAQDVGFNQPVIVYNENFLDFPAGTVVPLGYYDRGRGLWLPSDSGLVIDILGVSGGLAELDVDGSGLPASPGALAARGIGDDERERLAELYTAGQSLWRISVPHFSPHDANWPTRCRYNDCQASNGAAPFTGADETDPSCQGGSVIECQNQVLGEAIDLVGVPFALHYRSDRQPDFRTRFTIDIPLSGSTIHPRAKRIDLEVTIAGTRYTESFPAAPNQQTTFTWDGRDAYGRLMQGAQPARIRVGWVYDMEYIVTDRFGRVTGGDPVTDNPARAEGTLWKTYDTWLSVLEAELAGRSLTPHHRYDPTGQMLYLGDGSKHVTGGMHPIVETVGGDGDGSAEYLEYIAAGPDGSVYRYEAPSRRALLPGRQQDHHCRHRSSVRTGHRPLRRRRACHGSRVKWIGGFAVGPEGSVYLADYGINRVRRIGPDGIITTVAGTGVSGTTGDGGPATEARLQGLGALALGPDGSLYIGQMASNARVRQVDPAASSVPLPETAPRAALSMMASRPPRRPSPRGLAVAPDGSVHIVASRTAPWCCGWGLTAWLPRWRAPIP
ncbi:MAG: hypothetical protein R2844_03180 [Caldilineales bacterium]